MHREIKKPIRCYLTYSRLGLVHKKHLFINNKKYTIMTSLKKFSCKSAKIEIKMADLKENLDCLYIVSEEPKKKNAGWKKSTFKFWLSSEANAKFIELITFWCK